MQFFSSNSLFPTSLSLISPKPNTVFEFSSPTIKVLFRMKVIISGAKARQA
jgi:hypothetical protein